MLTAMEADALLDECHVMGVSNVAYNDFIDSCQLQRVNVFQLSILKNYILNLPGTHVEFFSVYFIIS